MARDAAGLVDKEIKKSKGCVTSWSNQGKKAKKGSKTIAADELASFILSFTEESKITQLKKMTSKFLREQAGGSL